MKTTFAYALVIVAASLSTAVAQVPYYPGPVHVYRFPPCAGHVHHASTVSESYGRGVAAIVQAQAQYNLLTSQAMINAAYARQLESGARRQSVDGDYSGRPASRENRTVENRPTQWPAALQHSRFAGFRSWVEQLSQGGNLSGSDRQRLTRMSYAALAQLKEHRAATSARDYQDARFFLERLARTAQPSVG